MIKIFMSTMVLLTLLSGGTFASNSFAPPEGKTLLLVGQDRDTISRYVRSTHSVPAGTMFYTSIQLMQGLDSSNEYGSGPQDAYWLLRSYPKSVIQVGLYMVNGLDETVAGQYDDNLKKLAQWIKQAHRPVYLRIGYEFDNPENRYAPDKYQLAFRYVVDFLRKQHVKNTAYVWHSYCVEKPDLELMDWYPGDDYVDWFAVSLYGLPAQLWSAADFLKIAHKHQKPFMIAESTTCKLYSVRAKIDWFNHVFQFIKDNKVEAFCYINSNWDVMPMFKNDHWGDARVEQYPEIKRLWLDEINQDRYLKASTDLFQLLGYGREKS